MGFKGKHFHPINQAENIFHHAQKLDYYTCIIGSHLPYGELFKERVDFSTSMSVAKMFGNGFFSVVKHHLVTGLLLLPAPFFALERRKVKSYFFNQFQIHRNNATHEMFTTIIQNQLRPTFAVFHYMIPHFPLMYNRDGPKKLFHTYQNTPSNYYGNLAYLDKKIGEIVSILKKADKFDNSLIIMTSDHSWRRDFGLSKDNFLPEKYLVPLFVKLPHQEYSIDIDSEFYIFKLGNFINKYLDGDFTSTEVKSLISKKNYFTPTPLEPKPKEKEKLKDLGYIE